MSGIAFIFYYIWELPIGVQFLIYNLPVLYLAYHVFGRHYAVDTVLGTVLFSFCVDATSFLAEMQVVHDVMLSAIFGGVLAGIGFGLVFKSGGNTGGFDVVGAVVKRYYSFDMGTVVFVLNFVIIALSAILYTPEVALFSLVSIYVTAELTNRVAAGFNRQKSIVVISSQSEIIGEQIMERCERGVTFLAGRGGFTQERKDILFVVANLTQVSRIKEVVDEFDPLAFMIVSDTSEVMGRGFTLDKLGYKEARRKQRQDKKA